MADTPTTNPFASWHHLVNLREDLIHKLNQNPPQRLALEDRMAAIEEQLLNETAPAIADISLKLRLIWSAELHGEDLPSRQKLGVLADLQRLAA